MMREKIFLLIYGNIVNLVGHISDNLFLQISGFLMILWCLIITTYDLIKIKKEAKEREKRFEELKRELEESTNSFEELVNKFERHVEGRNEK